jgi:hypothetical protein
MRYSEQGSVLLTTMVVLVLLTVLGMAAIDNSTVEIKLAANDKFHQVAFYNADSGVYVTPKVISACVDQGEEPSLSNGAYTPDGGTFLREIMGYDGSDSATDIRFSMGQNQADVDVSRDGVEHIAGGGVEFASGSEGIGVGSAGGVALFYTMDSFGSGPASSGSNVEARYRKVSGTPGGL